MNVYEGWGEVGAADNTINQSAHPSIHSFIHPLIQQEGAWPGQTPSLSSRSFQWSLHYSFWGLHFLKRFYIFIFREREKAGERGEKHHLVASCMHLRPAPQACAQTGWNRQPFSLQAMPNQLSHTSWGSKTPFLYKTLSAYVWLKCCSVVMNKNKGYLWFLRCGFQLRQLEALDWLIHWLIKHTLRVFFHFLLYFFQEALFFNKNCFLWWLYDNIWSQLATNLCPYTVIILIPLILHILMITFSL